LNITPKKEEKIKIKMSMATTMEPVRDSQVPSWLFGPRTDVLAAPAPIGPLSNTATSFVLIGMYLSCTIIVLLKKKQLVWYLI
jgi:hypothetical protein